VTKRRSRLRRIIPALATAVAALALLVTPASAVAPVAGYQATFGFSGPAGLYAYGMTWDATDNTVLVGDYWNNRVKRFTAAGQYIGLVSKTAPRDANGGICTPYGLEADPDGNVWVADQNCSRVVEFDHTGNWIRTIGRGGSPNYGFGCGGGKLNVPTHVLVDPVSRRVYVSDPKCGTVYAYSPTGTYLFEFNWTPANLGTKPLSQGMDFGPDGNIYVYEHNTRRIVVFNKDGQWVRNFAPKNDLNDVRGVAIDPTNQLLYAVGAYHNMVYEYKLDGTFVKQWGSSGSTPFDSVRYVAADNAGHMWVGDTWGYQVWKFDTAGNPLPWATPPAPPPNGGYNLPNGVTLSPDGKLFVVDTYEQRIQTFDTTKSCTWTTSCAAWISAFGFRGENPTADPGAFNYPRALDYGGGYLWMGDNGNAIIQYLPDGTFVNRIGTKGSQPGQFQGGVTGVEYANGMIYATDVTNCRLQIFNTSGTLVNYMGNCTQMQWPRGLAVQGNLAYVIEPSKNRVDVWNTDTKSIVRTLSPTCGGLAMAGPSDATFSPDGTQLYVTDTNNKRVVRMSPDGSNCTVVVVPADVPGSTLGNPRYLDFGPNGRLYVSTRTRHVYSFNITG
jgi:tripartite motif-containing protein 71